MPFAEAKREMLLLGFPASSFQKHLKFALALRVKKNLTTGVLMYLLAPKCLRILQFFKESQEFLILVGAEIDKRRCSGSEPLAVAEVAASQLRLICILKLAMNGEVPEIAFSNNLSFNQGQAVSKVMHLMAAATCVQLSGEGKAKVVRAIDKAIDKTDADLRGIVEIIESFERGDADVGDRCLELLSAERDD